MRFKDAKMTDEVREEILHFLRRFPNLTWAARHVGISPNLIYYYRQRDEVFDADVSDAIEIGRDALEGEAIRRAMEGVTKILYFQGIPIGEEQQYSDTLMTFLLRGYKPKRFNPGVKIGGADGQKITMTFNIEGDDGGE